MKKILFALAAAFVCISVNAQKGRLFDQPMIIKECNVDITTKGMLATTWIELEFYNDRDKEAEAKYNLQLNSGQAITGFQLMLGDTYRDGSIEERWKARQAYSGIVGKRMDPALLQMTGTNYYTLNIYPVPAKSSRKVKIKIEELLKCADAGYQYDLGVFAKDSIGKLSVQVNILAQAHTPLSEYGALKNKKFNGVENNYNLETTFSNIKNPGAIAFLLPKQCTEVNACMESSTGEFFLKVENKKGSEFTIDIKKLRVYWDCSASMTEESRKGFITFLSKVIAKYDPDLLTIVPFNQQLFGEKVFSKAEIKQEMWEPIVNQIKFEGATQFGVLNFDTNDDLILVFTDGISTWGKRRPIEMKTPVTFITTNSYYNYTNYNNYDYYDDYSYYNYRFSNCKNYYLYSGSYYDKKYDTVVINNLSKFTIGLLAVEDESGNKAVMPLPQQSLPVMVVNGKLQPTSKKVILKYGFGNRILFTQEFNLQTNCFGEDFEKAKALVKFETTMNSSYWYNTLSFGIDNKMVTWQTAYIVLEKIDDYVKYNITPPADLLPQCLERGYVRTDYKQRFDYIKKTENLDMLKLVAKEYNKRFDIWGTTTDKIDITTVEKNYAVIEQDKNKTTAPLSQSTNQQKTASTLSVTADNAKGLDEVVVVGYGTSNKKDFTGTVTSVRYGELRNLSTTSVAEALTGRVAGLQVTTSEGGPGSEIQLKIRGGTSITQTNEPLYIIDGIQVDEGLNSLSLADVESIDVLKDVGSTAIYGSRGANGVIMVTTKSGKYQERVFNGYTRLKNQKDVGYMQLIKNTAASEKYDIYKELEKGYEKNMTFYLDMALHFYEEGLTSYTDEMIQKAAEAGYGNVYAQTAIAFVYEHMKQYDKAIDWYKNLSEDNPMEMRYVRDLAWVYYQNNQVDSAVKVLYKGITKYGYTWGGQSLKLKDIMLADMNMMIALNKNNIDISYIPNEIIKPITADTRIIVESNGYSLYDLSFRMPGKKDLSVENPVSKTGARLQNADYSVTEFQEKNATAGKYKIKLKTYNYYNSASPNYVRIIKIINFGKETQSIDTDIVSLCNQNGTIEIDDFKIEQKK